MKTWVAILGLLAALTAWAPTARAAGEPGPGFTITGRLATDLGYHHNAKEQTNNKAADVTSAFVNLAGYSYMRANYTSSDKTAGGLIELGLTSKLGDSEAAYLRLAYAWWNFGQFKILAGHSDGWVGSLAHHPKQYLGFTEDAKFILTNWGYIYSSRSPQARLEWNSGAWGLALAAVQPGAEAVPNLGSGVDIHANLPRFDLAAQFKSGGFWTQPGVGWSQLKAEGVVSGGDDSVTAWIAILPLKYSVGPFTAKGEVHFGQNNDMEWSGELIAGLRSLPRSMPVQTSSGKIEDTRQIGGFMALEYKLTKSLEITGGLGLERLSNDAWSKANGYQNDDYTRKSWFMALPITVTSNFTVQPELAYYDYGESISDGKDNGQQWFAGVGLRFVF